MSCRGGRPSPFSAALSRVVDGQGKGGLWDAFTPWRALFLPLPTKENSDFQMAVSPFLLPLLSWLVFSPKEDLSCPFLS